MNLIEQFKEIEYEAITFMADKSDKEDIRALGRGHLAKGMRGVLDMARPIIKKELERRKREERKSKKR